MPRTPGEDESDEVVRDRPNLTGRAAMLALVVCMLAISLAYPLREYLAQRSDIGQLRAEVSEQEQRVERVLGPSEEREQLLLSHFGIPPG